MRDGATLPVLDHELAKHDLGVTNTSVTPARSTGPAIFAGVWALEQLWPFWVAPLIGAAIGGMVIDGWVVTSPTDRSVRKPLRVISASPLTTG